MGSGVTVGGTGVNVGTGDGVEEGITVGSGVDVAFAGSDGTVGCLDGGGTAVGEAVEAGSWGTPSVGPAWGSGVAVATRGGTGVEGESDSPQAPNRIPPPASNTVTVMVFRNFIVGEQAPIGKEPQ